MGPRLHLRKGATCVKACIWAIFGEVKNSTLGQAKMGHFSYLGDTTVGAMRISEPAASPVIMMAQTSTRLRLVRVLSSGPTRCWCTGESRCRCQDRCGGCGNTDIPGHTGGGVPARVIKS